MGFFSALTGIAAHSAGADRALSHNASDGFSHEHPGDVGIYRTMPLDRTMAIHGPDESGELAEFASQHSLLTESTVAAYKAKAAVAANDAKLQESYRDYQEAENNALTAKLTANASYLKALHGNREKIVKLTADTHHLIQAADHRAKVARGRMKQILEGSSRLAQREF